MCDPQVVWQARLIDGKAVVLAGDQHSLIVKVLHRVVGTVMAEFHLHCTGAASKTKQLVSKADTKKWYFVSDELFDLLLFFF